MDKEIGKWIQRAKRAIWFVREIKEGDHVQMDKGYSLVPH